MNLAQMYNLANAKSGYARADEEIYDALNESGFRVYAAVLKEFRGFFLKFDETSLVLTPLAAGADQEYPLPPDLTQIVHLAERTTASENWRTMAPETLGNALTDLQDSVGWDDFYADSYGGDSDFSFYGPYLDAGAAAAAQALQIMKIRVSPAIDTTRACQIAYTAKWLPITDGSSTIMLPDEGTYCMLNYAIAELRRASDDSAAGDYEDKGDRHLQSFLSWLRARQIQQPLSIETYGPGE
jgi:hypothetical protein